MIFAKRFLLIVACIFLASHLLLAQNYGNFELDRAKEAMNRGDFRYALSQFQNLSNNSNFNDSVNREAAYYIGFCYVKMHDPWNAISAYEQFLDRYENSGKMFIPDALFVLGRTYEEVDQNEKAIRLYRRCVDRFSSSDYARLSEERLRKLGIDDGHHGGGHGGNHSGYVSPEIRDLIELAKMSGNSYTSDQMLLKATRKARSGADFIALSKAVENEYTRGQVLEAAKQSPSFRMIPVWDIVTLAKTVGNTYTSDQFLLFAAQNVARTAEDFKMLAGATSNSYIRTQILQIAQNQIRGGPHFNIQMSVNETSALKTAAKATKVVKQNPEVFKTNPFVGFSFDKDRIQRIESFLGAVKQRKNIDAAVRSLSRDDLSLDTVKQGMKEYSEIKTFDKLHTNDK